MFSFITYKHSKFSLHKIHKAWLSQKREGHDLGIFFVLFLILLKLNVPEFVIKRDWVTKTKQNNQTKQSVFDKQSKTTK